MDELIVMNLLLLAVMVLFIFYLFAWYRKNRILVEWVENSHGANIKKFLRCRVSTKTGNFYPFNDFFSRKPIKGLKLNEVKDFFIMEESAGFLAPNTALFLKKHKVISNSSLYEYFKKMGLNIEPAAIDQHKDEILLKLQEQGIEIPIEGYEFTAYKVPTELETEGMTSDYTFSFCMNKRVYLYEVTKVMSKAEIMARVVLPVMLVALALFLIIYFPTLYEKVTGAWKTDVLNVLLKWGEAIAGKPPAG